MSLVKIDDLIAYMSDIDLTGDQRRGAKLVLEGIEAEVRRFLNRPVEETAPITESPRSDPATGMLLTRHSPVRSLISPDPLDPASGVELRDGRLYGPGFGPVTYTAGLSDDDLKFVKLQVLRIAAREMQNKHDDSQGNSGIGDGEDAPMKDEGLQDEDRARLRSLRKRVIAR